VAKLKSLGLVERQCGAADLRVREATITPKGKAMSDLVVDAQERMGRAIRQLGQRDIEELVRLMSKFADDMSADAPSSSRGAT